MVKLVIDHLSRKEQNCDENHYPFQGDISLHIESSMQCIYSCICLGGDSEGDKFNGKDVFVRH